MISINTTEKILGNGYYGAVESNNYSRNYTLLGFVFTTILLPAFIFLMSIMNQSEPVFNSHIQLLPDGNKVIELEVYTPKVLKQNPSVPKPITAVRTEYVAGNPIAANIVDTGKSFPVFSDWSNLNSSLSSTTGKTITLNNNNILPSIRIPSGINIQQEKLPDSKDISFVEVEPQIDLESLRKSIIYPQIAVDAGIQGKVIIRVLIDKTGKPIRNEIFYSESSMLETAAAKAVMKSVFTPAIQNEKPVSCWINIPVNFKLK